MLVQLDFDAVGTDAREVFLVVPYLADGDVDVLFRERVCNRVIVLGRLPTVDCRDYVRNSFRWNRSPGNVSIYKVRWEEPSVIDFT